MSRTDCAVGRGREPDRDAGAGGPRQQAARRRPARGDRRRVPARAGGRPRPRPVGGDRRAHEHLRGTGVLGPGAACAALRLLDGVRSTGAGIRVPRLARTSGRDPPRAPAERPGRGAAQCLCGLRGRCAGRHDVGGVLRVRLAPADRDGTARASQHGCRPARAPREGDGLGPRALDGPVHGDPGAAAPQDVAVLGGTGGVRRVPGLLTAIRRESGSVSRSADGRRMTLECGVDHDR
ncbi:hypothetical protein RHCRD62_40012 [Rhodococcus sp. RD6.2]|nr:hypothetical protein RHCRD62_40012 [Rhodococcus sp. RD6.2]